MALRSGLGLVLPAVLVGSSVATAGVRVAHLSPDTPAVNVLVGPAGGPLGVAVTGLEYPNLAPDAAGG